MSSVAFHSPPLAKQTGGLEAAISGLANALPSAGVTLADKAPIHHFHALWETSHPLVSRQLRENRIPYLVSPHGMLEPWAWNHRKWKKFPYYHLFEKSHLRGAATLLATAPEEAANLRAHVGDDIRIEHLPLGINPPPPPSKDRAALGIAEDTHLILFLSRVDPKKGIDLLISALEGAIKTPAGHDIALAIVGDGDPAYASQLRAQIAAAGDALPPIHWKGAIWGDEKWDWLRAADLFCLPTHSENFGIAVLEAMAVGTPVLTTDKTPWSSLAERDGVFIGTDTSDSIRETLHTAFADKWSPTDRASLAETTLSEFLWENLAPRYAQLYHSLITEK